MTETQETKKPDAPAAAAPASLPAAVPTAPTKPKSRRRLVLMLTVPLLVAAGGFYIWATGGRFVATDNAYVEQSKVAIAADVGGRIVALNAIESAPVKKGDVILEIDPEPYRIAVDEAQARLASARLQVEQLRATYHEGEAEVASNRENISYLTASFERQENLLKTGVAAQASYDKAQTDLATARQDLAQAQQKLEGARAALGGDPDRPVDQHPLVMTAQAAVEKAQLDLSKTEVRAPADGILAQTDAVRIGQYVTAATPLLSLVETGNTWVEANFKETDLTHMAVGQQATITVDAFPDKEYQARVIAIGAGTGSAFSILPAQNATGNWVKVVQRVPVRLEIADGAAEAMLRTGLSASVDVDTEHRRALPGFLASAMALIGVEPVEAATR